MSKLDDQVTSAFTRADVMCGAAANATYEVDPHAPDAVRLMAFGAAFCVLAKHMGIPKTELADVVVAMMTIGVENKPTDDTVLVVIKLLSAAGVDFSELAKREGN